MNKYLEDQLSHLRIPLFKLPWPEACSQNAELVESRMLEWADRYGLFINNSSYRDRVKRTRYAWLAARCYPNAEPQFLQLTAKYFLWFFLADDLFVDRIDTMTPSTLVNLTAMIDVLDMNAASPQPVYGELAWLDICQGLRTHLSAEHFERFAQGMRLWATTAGLQILNHLQPRPAGIRQYETIRRHTSGMNPCLALADAANREPVSPEEYYRPDVQRLCQYANNIVCWSNDIQSFPVEARQPGQFWSMVGTYAAAGHTLQESVDYIEKRVNGEIDLFVQLSDILLREASPRLSGFIDGLKYWIRGYMDWVTKDTLRYAKEFASKDANDCGVLAEAKIDDHVTRCGATNH